MKYKLLLSTFILSFVTLILSKGFAQENNAYAITGAGNGDFQWMNIRQIDLSTGTVTKTLYENGKTKFSLNYDIPKTNSARELINRLPTLDVDPGGTISNADQSRLPTGSMIAAAAYDKKHGKLFFAPMFLGELRWVDLASGEEGVKFYSHPNILFQPGNTSDEANHITRMTIGADGNGYAITNDGNHLIQFTTGKKIIVTDLGGLVDASSSNHISVHNKCSSWGGDIVADAYGKLYLFTAAKNVFKIDINSRVATYLGSVTGLSGAYTLNGAAVADDNSVVISSANTFEGFYKVSMKDLSSVKLNTTGQVYNSSDLANGNLLYAAEARNSLGTPQLKPEVIGNSLISVYPNPVIGSQVKVTFDNNKPGNYNIAITDIAGRILATKQVTVSLPNQLETIQLKTKPAGGMYMIKVTDGNKKNIFSDKLVIN